MSGQHRLLVPVNLGAVTPRAQCERARENTNCQKCLLHQDNHPPLHLCCKTSTLKSKTHLFSSLFSRKLFENYFLFIFSEYLQKEKVIFFFLCPSPLHEYFFLDPYLNWKNNKNAINILKAQGLINFLCVYHSDLKLLLLHLLEYFAHTLQT